MLTAKEAAVHLENLRRSHEITRQLQAAILPEIVIRQNRDRKWVAMNMKAMEFGWCPLPFHPIAAADSVAQFAANRWPNARITVRV